MLTFHHSRNLILNGVRVFCACILTPGKKARLSYLGHHSTNGASNGMEHHHHQSRPNHHNGRNGMQHAESDEEDSDGDEFDDDDDMDLKPRKSSSKVRAGKALAVTPYLGDRFLNLEALSCI
jgi:hypothetical protein